jgi:hypothetical protein
MTVATQALPSRSHGEIAQGAIYDNPQTGESWIMTDTGWARNLSETSFHLGALHDRALADRGRADGTLQSLPQSTAHVG